MVGCAQKKTDRPISFVKNRAAQTVDTSLRKNALSATLVITFRSTVVSHLKPAPKGAGMPSVAKSLGYLCTSILYIFFDTLSRDKFDEDRRIVSLVMMHLNKRAKNRRKNAENRDHKSKKTVKLTKQYAASRVVVGAAAAAEANGKRWGANRTKEGISVRFSRSPSPCAAYTGSEPPLQTAPRHRGNGSQETPSGHPEEMKGRI